MTPSLMEKIDEENSRFFRRNTASTARRMGSYWDGRAAEAPEHYRAAYQTDREAWHKEVKQKVQAAKKAGRTVLYRSAGGDLHPSAHAYHGVHFAEHEGHALGFQAPRADQGPPRTGVYELHPSARLKESKWDTVSRPSAEEVHAAKQDGYHGLKHSPSGEHILFDTSKVRLLGAGKPRAYLSAFARVLLHKREPGKPLSPAEFKQRRDAAHHRHKAETAPSVRQGSGGAPSRSAIGLFRQGQARPDTRAARGVWDSRTTEEPVGSLNARFRLHFPKAYRSTLPDALLPRPTKRMAEGLAGLADHSAEGRQKTGRKAGRKIAGSRHVGHQDLVLQNPGTFIEATRHPAMHEVLQRAVAVVRAHQKATVEEGYKKRLIPPTTPRGTAARAYKHAALLSLHRAGIGDYDFRMDAATKREMRPLEGFMRYAHRRVFDRLHTESPPGTYAPFKEEFGQEFRKRKHGQHTGEVVMRMRPNERFIKRAPDEHTANGKTYAEAKHRRDKFGRWAKIAGGGAAAAALILGSRTRLGRGLTQAGAMLGEAVISPISPLARRSLAYRLQLPLVEQESGFRPGQLARHTRPLPIIRTTLGGARHLPEHLRDIRSGAIAVGATPTGKQLRRYFLRQSLLRREAAIVTDKDGKVLYHTVGDATSVGGRRLADARRHPDAARAYHNHPDDSPPSEGDAGYANQTDVSRYERGLPRLSEYIISHGRTKQGKARTRVTRYDRGIGGKSRWGRDENAVDWLLRARSGHGKPRFDPDSPEKTAFQARMAEAEREKRPRFLSPEDWDEWQQAGTSRYRTRAVEKLAKAHTLGEPRMLKSRPFAGLDAAYARLAARKAAEEAAQRPAQMRQFMRDFHAGPPGTGVIPPPTKTYREPKVWPPPKRPRLKKSEHPPNSQRHTANGLPRIGGARLEQALAHGRKVKLGVVSAVPLPPGGLPRPAHPRMHIADAAREVERHYHGRGISKIEGAACPDPELRKVSASFLLGNPDPQPSMGFYHTDPARLLRRSMRPKIMRQRKLRFRPRSLNRQLRGGITREERWLFGGRKSFDKAEPLDKGLGDTVRATRALVGRVRAHPPIGRMIEEMRAQGMPKTPVHRLGRIAGAALAGERGAKIGGVIGHAAEITPLVYGGVHLLSSRKRREAATQQQLDRLKQLNPERLLGKGLIGGALRLAGRAAWGTTKLGARATGAVVKPVGRGIGRAWRKSGVVGRIGIGAGLGATGASAAFASHSAVRGVKNQLHNAVEPFLPNDDPIKPFGKGLGRALVGVVRRHPLATGVAAGLAAPPAIERVKELEQSKGGRAITGAVAGAGLVAGLTHGRAGRQVLGSSRRIYTTGLKNALREHLRVQAGGTPSPHHLAQAKAAFRASKHKLLREAMADRKAGMASRRISRRGVILGAELGAGAGLLWPQGGRAANAGIENQS